MPLSLRRVAAVCLLAALVLAGLWGAAVSISALAQGNSGSPLLRALDTGDAYVSPAEIRAGRAKPGDLERLAAAARAEGSRGVHEKLAIINGFPKQFGTIQATADYVRTVLNLSGVVVLVSPHFIGVSSDKLSQDEVRSIQRAADPVCIRNHVDCAIFAGHQAVSRIKDDQAASQRNAAIFWIVVLILVALVIAFLVWRVSRRRGQVTGRLNDLRRAASNTLAMADEAVGQIEDATAGKSMPADVRADYDRALGLRDTARLGLERTSSPEGLTQANQDAAQAVLALQAVMRRLGIQTPLSSPLDRPGHRCFYCGRDDRPPYTTETISDDKGNSMQVEVCAVDRQRLQQGQRPEMATVSYQGTPVPWWAVPGNPYYYSYGGPSWQYWLPFLVGMDVGSWFGGGWGGYGYGPDWDDMDRGDGGWVGGSVDAGAAAGSAPDASAGDFGGWSGGDYGTSDWSGGSSGGDAVGGDWGGGDGGGDFGGGDGGGDFGGGGDW